MSDQEREALKLEDVLIGSLHRRLGLRADLSPPVKGVLEDVRAALAAREEPNVESVSGLTLRCELAGALGVEPEGWLDLLGRVKRLAAREDTERPDEPTRALAEFHDALGDERGRGNAALRLTLHKEEHEELLDELSDKRLGIDVREPRADEDVDRTKLARELADVVYISYGTAHAFAIDLDAALREIHRAAMSKLDPATMVVREDGKIMKPHGFVPPDMSAAVRDTEQEHEG